MKPEFLKYPLAKFRAGLYKMKNDTGFNLRRTMQDEEKPATIGKLYFVLC